MDPRGVRTPSNRAETHRSPLKSSTQTAVLFMEFALSSSPLPLAFALRNTSDGRPRNPFTGTSFRASINSLASRLRIVPRETFLPERPHNDLSNPCDHHPNTKKMRQMASGEELRKSTTAKELLSHETLNLAVLDMSSCQLFSAPHEPPGPRANSAFLPSFAPPSRCSSSSSHPSFPH